MSIQLKIPDGVADALRLPSDGQGGQLMLELATSLYRRGILSFGKARELSGVSRYEFGLALGQRGMPRHYGADDLEDDIAYARR